MKRIFPYLLAALSGIIFFGVVNTSCSFVLMLLAYVPLLFAEHVVGSSPSSRSYTRTFAVGLLAFFMINLLSLYPFAKLLSWWLVVYCVVAALCRAAVFSLYAVVKHKCGMGWGAAAFLAFMTAWEYAGLHVVFSLPCLSAGALAFYSGNTALVQWYEYTGVLGGSVWVYLCNLLLFLLLRKCLETRKLKGIVKPLSAWLACVLLPVAFSCMIYVRYSEEECPVEALLVQPNIDPYTEKFSLEPAVQLREMLAQAKEQMTGRTGYVILPETALQGNLWLNNIEENGMVRMIRDSLLAGFPQARLIAGADMMQYYIARDGKAPTPTAKQVEEKVYYDFFNVALQVGLHEEVQVYKKSKLVLGTEYVPFVQRFPRLEGLVMELGGSAQSRGRQERPSLLESGTAAVAPVVCFESLFGEYVSEFVRMGAELICVISNDGWWDEHPIPSRHVRFAQLRAIENRRSVMRCANTGLSCLIDQRGDMYGTTAWWTKCTAAGCVNKNTSLTFYSRHGDYVGRIAVGCSLLLLCLLLWKTIKAGSIN